MSFLFDFKNVVITEFGIGIDENTERGFFMIPVDEGVQTALHEMASETWRLMDEKTPSPNAYEASEKYSSIEYIVLSIDDEMAASVKQLHKAENIDENVSALNNPEKFFAYFARFRDRRGERLTAVRRSGQFKGVLKKRLIQFGDNTLKMVPNDIFKLDNDFDYLVDSKQLHILRPSGFEFTAQLQEAVMAAVPKNIERISSDLNFVDLASIAEYAQKHTRAARYLASICSQTAARNINKAKLKNFCKRTGVMVSESNGKITVDEKNVLGFLEVLDRRRYEVDLADERPELFRAISRSKISSG